jgi:outer membrane receptor protein involved in Fe transport
LYVTLEKSFGEKLSTKIGTRFENTNANGNVTDKNLEVKRNNNNFLPYVSVNYTPTQNHNLSYSFSSRVARPAFWALNPARIYLTKVNYIQNNPFTKSEIYYNNELMYMYKNSYFVTASYNYTSNAAEQIPLHGVNKDGENVLAYIRSNYGDKQEIGLTFGMQKQFFKGIWSANHSLTLGHNIYKGSVDGDPTDTHNLVTFKKYNRQKC